MPDEHGWLPVERRELSLKLFNERREAELKTLTGRAERARLREALRTDTARLASLEAMAPMQVSDSAPNA